MSTTTTDRTALVWLDGPSGYVEVENGAREEVSGRDLAASQAAAIAIVRDLARQHDGSVRTVVIDPSGWREVIVTPERVEARMDGALVVVDPAGPVAVTVDGTSTLLVDDARRGALSVLARAADSRGGLVPVLWQDDQGQKCILVDRHAGVHIAQAPAEAVVFENEAATALQTLAAAEPPASAAPTRTPTGLPSPRPPSDPPSPPEEQLSGPDTSPAVEPARVPHAAGAGAHGRTGHHRDAPIEPILDDPITGPTREPGPPDPPPVPAPAPAPAATLEPEPTTGVPARSWYRRHMRAIAIVTVGVVLLSAAATGMVLRAAHEARSGFELAIEDATAAAQELDEALATAAAVTEQVGQQVQDATVLDDLAAAVTTATQIPADPQRAGWTSWSTSDLNRGALALSDLATMRRDAAADIEEAAAAVSAAHDRWRLAGAISAQSEALDAVSAALDAAGGRLAESEGHVADDAVRHALAAAIDAAAVWRPDAADVSDGARPVMGLGGQEGATPEILGSLDADGAASTGLDLTVLEDIERATVAARAATEALAAATGEVAAAQEAHAEQASTSSSSGTSNAAAPGSSAGGSGSTGGNSSSGSSSGGASQDSGGGSQTTTPAPAGGSSSTTGGYFELSASPVSSGSDAIGIASVRATVSGASGSVTVTLTVGGKTVTAGTVDGSGTVTGTVTGLPAGEHSWTVSAAGRSVNGVIKVY